MIHKTVSLADQIFERLETDILSGKYTRGMVLTELSLSEDLGVSRTPIREAIHRLEQEHLVESTGKGVMVLSITKEDAKIIFDIRLQIEGLAARSCAENITDEQLNELKELLDMQEFFVNRGDTEKVKSLDSEFHRKIYQCSGSPIYYDTLAPLHNKTQKFRKVNVSNVSRASLSHEEHAAIYDAIASRNPDAAEKAMREHIRSSQRRLEETTKDA